MCQNQMASRTVGQRQQMGIRRHGAANRQWFDIGYWRIEIQPGQPRRDDVFLIALSPTLEAPGSEPLQTLNTSADNVYGVVSPHSVTLFIDTRDTSELRFQLPAGPTSLLLAGLPAAAEVELAAGEHSRKVIASTGGIAQFGLDGPAGGETLLRWK
jgi:hypothetical protein